MQFRNTLSQNLSINKLANAPTWLYFAVGIFATQRSALVTMIPLCTLSCCHLNFLKTSRKKKKKKNRHWLISRDFTFEASLMMISAFLITEPSFSGEQFFVSLYFFVKFMIVFLLQVDHSREPNGYCLPYWILVGLEDEETRPTSWNQN